MTLEHWDRMLGLDTVMLRQVYYGTQKYLDRILRRDTVVLGLVVMIGHCNP